ncbi:MAG TPA: DUF87 domain-containing protein, partial [Terrimesophilobacter sp.]|nr:DUF87 domain-containing protein [Terrimesophilobacter sp.]
MSTSALSLDGRGFQFAGQIESVVELGSFVTLRGTDGVIHLGLVDDVAFTMEGTFRAGGRILGTISPDGRLDTRRSTPFAAARVEDAEATTVALLYRGTDATLTVGSYLASDGIPARLLADRFNRHTFWCGQSGSGKTYALGVVLEQILVHTGLPMVIFDPNADFVRLREFAAGS